MIDPPPGIIQSGSIRIARFYHPHYVDYYYPSYRPPIIRQRYFHPESHVHHHQYQHHRRRYSSSPAVNKPIVKNKKQDDNQWSKDLKGHLESPEFKVAFLNCRTLENYFLNYLDFYKGGMEQTEKMVATESKEKMGMMVRMELLFSKF